MKAFKIILIILTVLTLLFIWGHSVMPSDASTEESSFIKELVDEVLQSVSGNSSFAIPESLIRKSAHFFEYAVLGLEFAGLAILFSKSSQTFIIFYLKTAFPALLVAMTDESIQYFSKRFSSVFDVWLDLAGSSFAIIILYLIYRKRANKQK